MQHVKECFDAFLDSDSPGVVAIKGDWGAGKTYFVTNYLTNRHQLREKLVSFVSLFGLSSLEDVRRQIIPSAVTAKALSEGKTISRISKYLGIARKLPKVADLEQVFQAVENQLTRDLVVVFDDVERKGKELSLQSFLGLVNYLSEHAHCKVLIILNEDQLSPDDKQELNRFREKLLDREILFAPTYEDNARLFFKNQELFEHALSVFRRCDCRNLRVIKKCNENAAAFAGKFAPLGDESKRALLQQVIFLSCIFYQEGASIDFDGITQYNLFAIAGKDKDAEHFKGERILKDAGYWRSPFDEPIINYLKSGIFDEDSVAKLLNDWQRSPAHESLSQKQNQIYKMVHGNFLGDAATCISELTGLLDAHLPDLDWKEIAQAMNALKELGYKGDTAKWSDGFITSNVAEFSLRACADFGRVATSDAAKKAIAERRTAILRARSPREIIYGIVEHMGWNPEDTDALKQYSSEDLADWLKQEKDERLLAVLNSFVKLFGPRSEIPDCQQINKTLLAALRQLAKENEFIRHKIVNVVGVSAEDLQV
jgi:hypothetical protein